jgi:nanoRNase/pAp phosphatase (c-di-AMP/oligoRNAs hydrolase)
LQKTTVHLITRSSLHDSALRLLSDRLAELTTVVYSDNDETTASKIRNTNKRLGDFERTLGELRRHVCSLEHRVSMVVRQQQVQQAAGGGGHGRKILRVRSKKRKVAGGEAVDVSLGDGGGGGGGGAGGSAVAEELGEVESMLAEVCCDESGLCYSLCGLNGR